MGHTIQIPDDLWELYDGSPMTMRDTLWQAKMPKLAQRAYDEYDFGTFITLQWATTCSADGRPIFEGERGLIRTRDGVRQVLCMECARRDAQAREAEIVLGGALE